MAENESQRYFGVADLVIFIGLLLVSAVIGAFFAYTDRKDKSTENYFFGSRKLSSFAVAMSMSVSFISAITVIGYPTEIYLHGIVFMWIIPAMCFSVVISTIYYIPLIYRLKLDTIYEYLELRNNKFVRKLVSGTVIIETLLYMGITVYLPALALEAVTPLKLDVSIVLTSLICTFYTAVGGMKAVIWTDVIQGFVILFGSVALFINTVVMVGGFENMAAAVERGGRNILLILDPDPRIRSSSFTIFVGYFTMQTTGACCSQIFLQRYLSCKSETDAKIASIIRLIPSAIFLLLEFANGLAMYAYFEGRDPKDAGFIEKRDQTTPRLAIEAFQDLPGMAGLFVSAAYSGTLSTVSSGINALSAMSTEDFIRPRWPRLGASRTVFISKGFSVLYGVLVMSIAFVISTLQSTVIQIAATVSGIIGGSVLSVYTMGIFCPWTNSIGAFGGLLVGWAVTGWVTLSSIIHKAAPEFSKPLPLTTEGCNFTSAVWTQNFTYDMNISSTVGPSLKVSTLSIEQRHPLGDDTIFSISPFLYGFIGFLVGCLAMIIISLVTGVNKAKDANPELFVPLLDNKNVFPNCMVKFFRFGVPERESEKKCTEETQTSVLLGKIPPEKGRIYSDPESVSTKS